MHQQSNFLAVGGGMCGAGGPRRMERGGKLSKRKEDSDCNDGSLGNDSAFYHVLLAWR
jgi:hypothetical protein